MLQHYCKPPYGTHSSRVAQRAPLPEQLLCFAPNRYLRIHTIVPASQVRIMEQDGKEPLFEVPTPSPPTALLYVPDSHDPRHRWAGRASRGKSSSPHPKSHGALLCNKGDAATRSQTALSLRTSHPAAASTRFPEGSHELLYGCDDGRVVQLMVERGAVRQGFTITPPPGAGAVRSMHCGADYSRVRSRQGGDAGRGWSEKLLHVF